jgi:hypothetical protein
MNDEQNKFDFNKFSQLSSPEERYRMLDNSFKEADYLVLSDPFMYRSSGGTEVLQYIEQRVNDGMYNKTTGRNDRTKPFTWRLKLLKHTNGSKPKPGDRIEWVTQRTNKIMDKKIGTTQARDLIRRGDGDRLTHTNAAVLDNDCCFVVGFEDASHLLSNNGVYFRTGYPISNLPEHFRTGAYHNWRYVEVPPGMDNKNDAFADQEKPGAGIVETQGGGKGRR